ncbi:MAG: TIR domain-containing protein [Crocosphaera sp.]
MSITSTQNGIERTQGDIQNLNKKLSDETKKEADRSDKIFRAKQTISRSKSNSTIQSKSREIQRYEGEVSKIQKKKAELTKQITNKTKQLYSYQNQLNKLQEQEQKKQLELLQREQRETQYEQESLLHNMVNNTTNFYFASSPEYDVFICHASEDKETLVRPLAEKLTVLGVNIWYDEFRLTIGDSLRRSIDKGLSQSRFGIVVLSPSFFAKNWTQYELNGLVNREVNEDTKVVLPLWHKVSKDEVRRYSPSLADKIALNTSYYTLDELGQKLLEVLKP